MADDTKTPDINDQALEWAKANPTDSRAQDVMAKAWANQNPDDPRAAQIHAKFETPQQQEPSLYQKFMNYTKPKLQTAEDFAQGAGKSMLDTQIVPAINASIASATGEAPDLSWAQKYRQMQDDLQQQQKASQQRSPTGFGTGEVAGMILPAIAGAGLASGGARAAEAIAPSLLKRVGTTALEGAASGTGVGALQGASTSEGHLIDSTPEERTQLLKDTASGAMTGAVAGTLLGGTAGALKGQGSNIGVGGTIAGGAAGAIIPGMNAQTGALVGGTVGAGTGLFKSPEGMAEYFENSPAFRHMAEGFGMGKKGINITNQAQKVGQTTKEKLLPGDIGPRVNPGLQQQAGQDATFLNNGIYEADKQLGQKVSDSLNPDITPNAAKPIDLTDPILDSLNSLKTSIEKDQTILSDPNAQKLYDKIFQISDHGDFDTATLTPQEVNSLRNDASDFANSIKQKSPGIAKLGFDFSNQARELLGNAIPEYDIAATRFSQFRKLVPETIMSRGTPVDISQISMGNLKNSDSKLYNATLDMINGSQKSGNANEQAQLMANQLMSGYNQFENLEGQRLANGQITQDDLIKILPQSPKDQNETQMLKKWIQQKSDQSALLRKVWGENPQEGVGTILLGAITGAKTGEGVLNNVANKYGLSLGKAQNMINKAKTSTPAELTQKLTNLPQQGLRDLAQSMSRVPGLKSAGDALTNGLNNKDITGVNAAIFSIMQNPQARIFLNSQNLKSEDENGK